MPDTPVEMERPTAPKRSTSTRSDVPIEMTRPTAPKGYRSQRAKRHSTLAAGVLIWSIYVWREMYRVHSSFAPFERKRLSPPELASKSIEAVRSSFNFTYAHTPKTLPQADSKEQGRDWRSTTQVVWLANETSASPTNLPDADAHAHASEKQHREWEPSQVVISQTNETSGSPTILTDAHAPKPIAPPHSEELQEWGSPHIHIVSTRFMQQQGNLTTLGKARLELFKVFCLPTMKYQTSQDFLWIIRTDPNLDKSLQNEMVDLLKGHPNFYLVASNENKFPSEWRDGSEDKELLRSKIFSGDRSLLESAMWLLNDLPLLETRLDADDGLRVQFIESIQQRALSNLTGKKKKDWMYYCIQSAMEWRWFKFKPYGSLMKSYKPSFCATPGLTLGLSVGVTEEAVPKGKHSALFNILKKLPNEKGCGHSSPKMCLVFLGNSTFDAIRSRTPTSAGMSSVMVHRVTMSRQFNQTSNRLRIMENDFHIPRSDLKMVNTYVGEHIIDIAKDNLKGQCTPGHSCKVREITSERGRSLEINPFK